jgi:hypothetical protein
MSGSKAIIPAKIINELQIKLKMHKSIELYHHPRN